MRTPFQVWALVTFTAGLLLFLVVPLHSTPLGALYPPELAAQVEEVHLEFPAAEAVTPTGWLIVAAVAAACVLLVLRGLHHLRA